jgi:hypothetical protein
MYKKILVFAISILICSSVISYGAELQQTEPLRLAPVGLAPYLLNEREMKDMELTDQQPAIWQRDEMG